jgi:acetate kinase
LRVLVINAGSSSLKFTLYQTRGAAMLARGIVERIGLAKPELRYEAADGRALRAEAAVADHGDALKLVCGKLVDADWGVLKTLAEVEAIGHRVVHGGERFTAPVRVDDEVKKGVRQYADLAPLHNPPNLGGIEACERVFPGTPNVAVFDTAFHQTMPPASYLFAIPYELYEKYGLRKYGFHGTSHKFVSQATARFLGRRLEDLRLVTCHLGNGCSIAAVSGGRVLDTSMGMTPLMGLVMGTRCGDIDPGAVLYLVKQGMSADQVDTLLNRESGLLGVASIGSGDMRDVIAAAEQGQDKARRALDMFVHRLVSYVGSYHVVLGGADAVVFTGGIGENSVAVRERVVTRLRVLGCHLDRDANAGVRGAAVVSTPGSTLKAVVMPTDEELMIAQETERLLGGAPRD